MKLQITSLSIPTDRNPRTLRILLPDDYETSHKSYPVLYMHDGQNLFEDHTSYSGHAWQVLEALEQTSTKDLIVVGIDNSDLRLFEYAPWPCDAEAKAFTKIQVGGLGDVYANWVVHTLKPWIDQTYPTKKEKEHTFIAGSSMGAYISVYLATAYPNVFQTVGVFSLSSWFNERQFLAHLDQAKIDINQRYFITVGRFEESKEPSDMNDLYIMNSRRFKDKLIQKGVHDIFYQETDDAHHELAWRKIFPTFITFIKEKCTR
jgi:predicted alpha/beta superfamily hydrolase